MRLTREESQAITRERILQAAGDIVARDGYDGASVERIAEAAGYSKGAFYSNFASKEEVISQLLAGYSGHVVIDLEQALEGLNDSTAVIDAVARWSDSRAAEMKWGLLAIELLRRAHRDNTLTSDQRQMFVEQWRDVGNLLNGKLFPLGNASMDPVDLGGIIMDLTFGSISIFLDANSTGQMVAQILSALVAANRAAGGESAL
jgi:AcrR family transcriptional regulator